MFIKRTVSQVWSFLTHTQQLVLFIYNPQNHLNLYFLGILVFLLIAPIPSTRSTSTYTPSYGDPFLEPWRWQLFSELSGKRCRCMVEDKNGSLWFGINGGVLRYSGIKWKYYPINNDSTGTPVVSLCAASDGILYVGTSKGISRFKYGKWQPISLNLGFGNSFDFPNNKYPIIEAVDKSIWIGTRQGALRIRNDQMTLYREKNLFINLQNKDTDYINNEIRVLPDFDVYSIFIDEPDKIWFGLRDGRIYRCHFYNYNMTSSPVWQRIDTERGYIKAKFPLINRNKEGKIFIVSGEIDKGVNIYNGQGWVQLEFNRKFGVDDIHADILESKDGTLWIGSVACIFALKSNKWYMYESLGLPLPSNRWNLYETRDGSLWIIGLGNEVWRVDLSTQKWTTYKGIHFQSESKDGDKWFLAYDGAIIKSDSSMNTWIRYDQDDGVIDAPSAVMTTKSGVVWTAGSHNQVAATAYLDGGRWIKRSHPRLSWGIGRRAVFEANDGSLWFGSAADFIAEKGQIGGLVQYINPADSNKGKQQFEYHYFDDNFYLSAIYGIGQSADGLLWTGQLAFYNYNDRTKLWQKITEPAGLDESFIDCIYTSLSGNIWVGTRTSGVFWYETTSGNWSQFTSKNGLSSNTIINILAEADTNVWVATDQNICHFDGKSWAKNIFTNFIKITKEGISIHSTRDGTIWFNQIPQPWLKRALHRDTFSNEFLDEYISIRYQPDHLPPETSITFSQERIGQPGNVILSWIAHDPWKSTSDNQLQYSYRLDNEEWSPYTSKTNQILLNVSDGNHTFEVRARDRDLNFDQTPAKVTFNVIPPTWKQPWFLGLIFFFISTITLFIFHLVHRNKIIRELSEAKVRLFTNISHELRTPLTLIIGPLNNLIGSINKDNKWQSQLGMMYRNCNRLMRLVNQILDFQKMEAGRLKFEPGKGDIVTFIRDVANSFQALAGEKQIDFRVEFKINELQMWFDSDKIEKILFNLVSNAFKFTPTNGTISIVVSQVHGEKEEIIEIEGNRTIAFSNWLVILVKDSGGGIPPQKLDKIFNRFYQVDDPSVSHAGGTGIGLSLTKELVELHFGELAVESKKGEGTVFKIKIPIIIKYYPDEVIQHDIKKSGVSELKHVELRSEKSLIDRSSQNGEIKILLVEDNSDMRHFICDELESEYQIYEAIDGEDGLEKALKHAPDLIVSDVMMPHMDGIEFCRKIKTDERTSHIPVILLTARSSQMHKIEGLETGADDYITKPFNSIELKIRIQNIIESRRKLWERFQREIRVEPREITINSVDEQFLSRAIEIIEEHMDDPEFDPKLFSRKIGMSRAGLYNKLRTLTGHSVRDFIIAIRLKRSAQLLKQSGLTVTQIAYEVGFKDPSHFTKLFKKQFGKSPKAYIREHIQ